jgi:ABC-type multidrug transport system permease subunit
VTRSSDYAGGKTRLLRSRASELVFKEIGMLYTIAAVLLILWVLGLVTANTIGGFIHILLAIAIVVVLLRVIGIRG